MEAERQAAVRAQAEAYARLVDLSFCVNSDDDDCVIS